jgi:3-oxoacyl-[acyl-carrier-protein] synthase II
MARQREVVITGTGVVSPVGIGKHAYWEAIERGDSGVARLTILDPSAMLVPFGGEVRGFQPKEFVTPRKSLKVMCREIQTGYSAARLALDDAQLAGGTVEPDRLGVLFGSEMFYCDLPEIGDPFRTAITDGHFDLQLWGRTGMNRLYPLWLLMYLPNMVACHIGIANDARGPNNTVTAGEASGLLALIEATRVIERGHADVMVAGGTGTRLHPTGIVYRTDSNLSHRFADPAAACRPFDAQRDGMVNGEGAAAFVLEARAHAEARGATIQARILGCGQGFDSNVRKRNTSGYGFENVIRAALREAELEPAAVGHVNAHGVSTVADDRREALAIRRTLGDTPVTAPKSFFGNLGAGGGVVEMVASVLALTHGRVPYTRNYQFPDAECDINVIRDHPLETRLRTAIVLSQSSMGQTAALVLAGG